MPIRYQDSNFYQPVQLKAANVYVNDTGVPVCISEASIPLIIANAFRVDGADIVVTDVNGNLIPREIASFNRALGTIQLWYKDPAVSTLTGGTQLYLQCGGPSVNVANDATVWSGNYGGATNHALVVHGEETAANLTDASSNYAAADANITYNQVGKIKGAPQYNGSTSVSNFGDITEINNAQKMTMMSWFNQDVIGSYDFFYFKELNGALNYDMISFGALLYIRHRNGATGESTIDYTPYMSAGFPCHITHVFDGSLVGDARIVIYFDKIQRALTYVLPPPAQLAPLAGINFFLGSDNAGSAFSGKIDEFRLVAGAISANQLSGQYDNQDGFALNSTLTIGGFAALSSGFYKYW